MIGWLRRLRGAFFVFLFLAAFFYISSLNFRPPERMDLLQRFVVETVGPFVKSFGNLSGLIEDAVSEYGTPEDPVASAGQMIYAPSTARFGGPRQVQLGVKALF